MSRPISTICTAIESFRPADGEWLPLEKLLTEAFEHSESPAAFSSLLDVFRRFPDDDGAGVFWTIVHGLEAQGGYEVQLVDAVRRQPTQMSVMMVNRMLNGGVRQIGDVSLLSLLHAVAGDKNVSHAVRADASRFADGHGD